MESIFLFRIILKKTVVYTGIPGNGKRWKRHSTPYGCIGHWRQDGIQMILCFFDTASPVNNQKCVILVVNKRKVSIKTLCCSVYASCPIRKLQLFFFVALRGLLPVQAFRDQSAYRPHQCWGGEDLPTSTNRRTSAATTDAFKLGNFPSCQCYTAQADWIWWQDAAGCVHTGTSGWEYLWPCTKNLNNRDDFALMFTLVVCLFYSVIRTLLTNFNTRNTTLERAFRS